LTEFSSELSAGLSEPLARFESRMLFGVPSSQEVKLSKISRSLKEDAAQIRTEKRLSCNLKRAENAGAVGCPVPATDLARLSPSCRQCIQ